MKTSKTTKNDTIKEQNSIRAIVETSGRGVVVNFLYSPWKIVNDLSTYENFSSFINIMNEIIAQKDVKINVIRMLVPGISSGSSSGSPIDISTLGWIQNFMKSFADAHKEFTYEIYSGNNDFGALNEVMLLDSRNINKIIRFGEKTIAEKTIVTNTNTGETLGEYLVFLSTGYSYNPRVVASLVQALASYPSHVVCFGGEVLDKTLGTTGTRCCRKETLNPLKKAMGVPAGTKVIRMDADGGYAFDPKAIKLDEYLRSDRFSELLKSYGHPKNPILFDQEDRSVSLALFFGWMTGPDDGSRGLQYLIPLLEPAEHKMKGLIQTSWACHKMGTVEDLKRITDTCDKEPVIARKQPGTAGYIQSDVRRKFAKNIDLFDVNAHEGRFGDKNWDYIPLIQQNISPFISFLLLAIVGSMVVIGTTCKNGQ